MKYLLRATILFWLVTSLMYTGCRYVDRANPIEFPIENQRIGAISGDLIKGYLKSKDSGKKPWKVSLRSLGIIPSFDEDIGDDLSEGKIKIIYVDKLELQSLATKIQPSGGAVVHAPSIQPPESSATLPINGGVSEKLALTATSLAKARKLPFEFSTKDSSQGDLIVYLFLQNRPPVQTKGGMDPDSKSGHRHLDSSVRVSLFLYENGKAPGVESFRCQKRLISDYPSDWLLSDWFFPKKAQAFDAALVDKGIAIRKNETKTSTESYSLASAISDCFEELSKEATR